MSGWVLFWALWLNLAQQRSPLSMEDHFRHLGLHPRLLPALIHLPSAVQGELMALEGLMAVLQRAQ